MSSGLLGSGLSFLNVGTRVLSKDIMDQYIRTLGEHRTFYATTAKVAHEILHENPIDFIFLENDLPDGTGFSFVKALRENREFDLTYLVLAIEKDDLSLRRLAQEMDVDSVLIKPLTTKRLGKEIEHYEKRIRNSDEIDRVLREGKQAFKQKMYREADHLFKKALTLKPELAKVQTAVGNYYLIKPDPVLALRHFSKAIEIDPKYPPAHAGLGAYYYKKKDFDRAFTHLNKAQILSPLNTERPLELAKLHVDWAVSKLRTAYGAEKNDPKIGYELARLMVMKRDYPSALTYLKGIFMNKKDALYKEKEEFTKIVRSLGSLR